MSSFWMTLISGYNCTHFLSSTYTLFQGLQDVGQYYYFALAPIAPFLICAPLIGWFMDTRFGSYKVFKAGTLLTFLATVMACVCVLILENISKHSTLSRGVERWCQSDCVHLCICWPFNGLYS